MEANPAFTSGLPIQIRPSYEEEDEQLARTSCRNHCRNIGTCFKVVPWVPLLGTIMIGAGLPVWAIFTRKAMQSTVLLSDTLLGTRTYVVDQLFSSVDWVTGLSVIVMSSIVGLALLLSLVRSYQEAARMPNTKCATPSRLSLGGYVTLMPPITFGLWLMTVVVSLLIAAQLVWLVLAFMFEAALTSGIRPSTSTVTPQAFYEATDAVLTALVENEATLPTDGPAGARISRFVAGAKQAGVNVCPTSCVDLGSFTGVFEAPSPCLCGSAEQYPLLLSTATLTWQYLVHALAALALMGLAGLWLIMNLSAQFAHARRDMAEAKAHSRYHPESRRISDISDAAAVYVTTNPTYSSQPDKKAAAARKQDTSRDADTHQKAPSKQPSAGGAYRDALPEVLRSAGGAPSSPPPPVAAPPARIPVLGPVAVSPFERTSPELTAENNVAAAAAAVAAAAAAVAGASYGGAPPPLPLPPQRPQLQEVPQPAPVAAAPAPAPAPAATTTTTTTAAASKRGGAVSPRLGQARGESPDRAETASPTNRQYNTTAQRYAAYRLRAAQANGGRLPSDRVRWAH